MSPPPTPPVSLTDFYAAVDDGDIATIEAYFTQHHVRAIVDRHNAWLAANAVANNAIHPEDEGFHDMWYYYGSWHRLAFDRRYHVFGQAIANRQFEVLAWFFAPERVVSMGATLVYMLPSIFKSVVEADDTEALELVLMSPAVQTLASNADKYKRMLREALCMAIQAQSTEAIPLLLAHGVCLDYGDHPEPMRTCAAIGSADQLDLLVANGAVVVGSAVLKDATVEGNLETATRLLQLGGDSKYALWIAADMRRPEIAKLFLRTGYMDVDARCADIGPPLFAAVHQSRVMICSEKRQERTLREFLEFGADINITDKHGKTPLHKAAGRCNFDVVQMLLEHGANPNAKTDAGKTVLDRLQLQWIGNEETQQDLVQLLQYGADPFVVGAGDRSAYDRLRETDEGKAFIAAHAEYF